METKRFVALAPLFVIAIVLGSRSIAAQEVRKHEEKPDKQSAVPKRALKASQKSAMEGRANIVAAAKRMWAKKNASKKAARKKQAV